MKFCTNCNVSVNVDVDDAAGNTTCSLCGVVLEENQIVSEVTFSEQANGSAVADGIFLAGDQSRAKNRSRFGTVRTNSVESREHTLTNGYRRVEQIGTALHFSERQMDAAKRYFNLAVINNFTKGRKTNNVVAACLYIVSRMEKTSHMLIDFADLLQTNVYVLGAAFLRLVQVLRLNLPLIDPALYIARFAGRLDMREKTQDVVKDALRLVQRMNRDWIQTGRRPAGVCAASLFIASRMHNFKRSYREIIRVVKICEATLRKRLDEFKSTPTASLSVSEFQTIWLEEGCDPPSYQQVGTKRRTAGNLLENAPSKRGSLAKVSVNASVELESESGKEDSEDDELFTFDEELEAEMKKYLQEKELKQAIKSLSPNVLSDKELDFAGEMDAATVQQELELLDNDDEVNAVLLDKVEVEVKTKIWVKENQEWLLAQELKAKKDIDKAGKANSRKNAPGQKKTLHNLYHYNPAASIKEATMSFLEPQKGNSGHEYPKRRSKGAAVSSSSGKIDYSVLQSLFKDTSADFLQG